MNYKNLTIIGTSHIARQSLMEIHEAFKEKPDIVALELDDRRLYGLLHEIKASKGMGLIKTVGFNGYLFSLIGAWIQKKLGSEVGVMPGSEMKLAYKLAKKNNCRVELIDQDILITLRKFSKAFTWREKLRIVADIFNGIFFGKRELKEMGFDGDLSKVPEREVIKKMIQRVKKRYPGIYKVLVEDRNYFMANNLQRLLTLNPDKKILAIVGAGHEEEIIRLLKLTEGRINYTYSFAHFVK
jgi:pheromone shutdown-related protein TraB